VATITAAAGGTRAAANVARSTGKYYIEFERTAGLECGFGVRYAKSGTQAAVYYMSDGDVQDESSNALATEGTYAVGDIVGIALDMDTDSIWFSVNGVWQSGDPSTGSSPTYTGALLTGPAYVPFAYGAADNDSFTMFPTTSSFTYTKPTGYSAWGDSDVDQ